MNIILLASAAGAAAWLVLTVRGKSVVRKLFIRHTDKPAQLVDYKNYQLTVWEWLLSFGQAGSVLFIIMYLFFNHLTIALLSVIGAALYPRLSRKRLKMRRQEHLQMQFKQVLYSISSSLSAGKSIENAFREAVSDIQFFYPEAKVEIMQELIVINAQLENGEPMEKALFQFSERAGLEDIRNFTDVFITCKRTGGDLIEVIRRTSTIIADKQEVEQDIQVTIAQKRFEAKALAVVPFFIISFLRFGSSDYMLPLYHGRGYIVMSSSLILLLFCYWWIHKLMKIRV